MPAEGWVMLLRAIGSHRRLMKEFTPNLSSFLVTPDPMGHLFPFPQTLDKVRGIRLRL